MRWTYESLYLLVGMYTVIWLRHPAVCKVTQAIKYFYTCMLEIETDIVVIE